VGPGVAPGRVLDLSVTFGNQKRFKCAACKHFMRVNVSTQVACSCGQRWVARQDGRFEAAGD
jgi:hypothetical protein